MHELDHERSWNEPKASAIRPRYKAADRALPRTAAGAGRKHGRETNRAWHAQADRRVGPARDVVCHRPARPRVPACIAPARALLGTMSAPHCARGCAVLHRPAGDLPRCWGRASDAGVPLKSGSAGASIWVRDCPVFAAIFIALLASVPRRACANVAHLTVRCISCRRAAVDDARAYGHACTHRAVHAFACLCRPVLDAA